MPEKIQVKVIKIGRIDSISVKIENSLNLALSELYDKGANIKNIKYITNKDA